MYFLYSEGIIVEQIIKLSESRYVWLPINNVAPTAKGDFPGTNRITNLSKDITFNGETGKYYLWIYVEDELGNWDIVGITDSEGNLVEFWIDNTKSELDVKVTPTQTTAQNVWDGASIEITATDTEAGINTSITYKYHLSSSVEMLINQACLL